MNEDVTTAREETVPKLWPGAFGAFAYSKAAVRINWKPIVLCIIASVLVGALSAWIDPVSVSGQTEVGFSNREMIANLISVVAGVFIGAAATLIYLKSVRQQKIEFIDSFTQSVQFVVRYFLLTVLVGVIAFISVLLLIIPFFFIMPRLALSHYFLIDKNLGPVESISASWRATKGNVAKIWGIVGVSLLIGLLCVTIIGIPFAIYLGVAYSAAYAVLYIYLTDRTDADKDTPLPVTEGY